MLAKSHGLRAQEFRWGSCMACFFMTLAAAGDDVSYSGIPYKPDPPPAIDGQLDEWSTVPGTIEIHRRDQAVYGAAAWQSPRDLSAKAWLAWRGEHLYLAAAVNDDRHLQRGRGPAMWKGDHLELYLDLAPDLDPHRNTLGTGQVHLGFSPGNLEKTGDPLVDIRPEATIFTPEGVQASDIQMAAQKTSTGYVLEAAIPWTLLARLAGTTVRPTAGMPVNFEIGLSDCDGPEPAQETLMTVLTTPWQHTRSRLVTSVLAGPDGKGEPPIRAQGVLESIELPPKAEKTAGFSGLSVPTGKEAVLVLKARLATPRVAGYTPGLRLTLNGQTLNSARLTNWEREEIRVDGRAMTPAAGETFNVPYAPDFDAPNRHPSYGLRSGPKLCRYELRVTDLLRPGQNTLVIRNAALPEIKRTLVVADVKLEIRTPVPVRTKRPAPTGPVPVVRPQPPSRVPYTVVECGPASLELHLGRERFRVESEFSTPMPVWVHGPNAYFDFRREIVRRDEAILVRDTFTNRTSENLPLMHRHRVFVPGLKAVCLAGLSPTNLETSFVDPANPTSYGATATAGVGLLPLDDVMQVHAKLFSAADHVGLADNQLVLPAGRSYTAEWAIVPTVRPAYYDMVNAVRRLRGVNFTLPGSFAFLRAHPRTMTHLWSDQQFIDFVRFKNAHFICDGYGYATYKGRFPHGTVFQGLDYTVLRQQIERLRRLLPEARHQLYFHCFLDVLDEAPEKYADARLLCVDGSQATYGKPYERIFVPTERNSFGRDIARNVEMILGAPPAGFGCEGVYWDEFEYSRYQWHYADFSRPDCGLPWDGVSGDIDPKTMKLTRLKSSVELLSQPFRLALARRILQGHDLVANGQPHTRTMATLHFPRFVETGSISNCAHTLLYSPIALGDHLTERSEVDAYRVMLRALDFGCVYYWYNDVTVIPTHRHLTSYMFPITPLELGEGYLIGRERIVTNRSGRYGWGDASRHEVHVFDDQGRECPQFKAPTVTRDGQTFTELRLPEDFSAAIVRK